MKFFNSLLSLSALLSLLCLTGLSSCNDDDDDDDYVVTKKDTKTPLKGTFTINASEDLLKFYDFKIQYVSKKSDINLKTKHNSTNALRRRSVKKDNIVEETIDKSKFVKSDAAVYNLTEQATTYTLLKYESTKKIGDEVTSIIVNVTPKKGIKEIVNKLPDDKTYQIYFDANCKLNKDVACNVFTSHPDHMQLKKENLMKVKESSSMEICGIHFHQQETNPLHKKSDNRFQHQQERLLFHSNQPIQ